MKFTIDLDTLALTEAAKTAKRGDASLFEVTFVRDGIAQDLPENTIITFVAKQVGDFTGDPIVMASDFVRSELGTDAKYLASPSFNSAPLVALFVPAVGAADIAYIDLVAEFSWATAGGLPTSSKTFFIRVDNDVFQGDEGTPVELPTPEAWLAARAQPLSANLTAYAADPATAIATNLLSSTGGLGLADAGKVVRFGAVGELKGAYNTGIGSGVHGSSTSGNGVSGVSTSGTGVYAYSSSGPSVNAYSVSGIGVVATSTTGTYHATFGNSGVNRSFVANEKGAFGWIRGAFTGRIHPPDTLGQTTTWILPDPGVASATVALVESINTLAKLDAIVADATLARTDAANTFAGVQSFTSRPTSGGSNLISQTDADNDEWVYIPGRQRIKVINLALMIGTINGTGSAAALQGGGTRLQVGTSAADVRAWAGVYQTGNNNNAMVLALPGATSPNNTIPTICDWSRSILLSYYGMYQASATGMNVLIALSSNSQNGGLQMIDSGVGAELIWNGTSCDVRLVGKVGGSNTVTAATNASPIVVSTTAHGYANGDLIRVANVAGNTAANGWWTVANVTANTFELAGSTGNGAWTSGGTSHRTTGVLGTIADKTAFALDVVATSGTATLYLNGVALGTLVGVPTAKNSAYAGVVAHNVANAASAQLTIDTLRLGVR